MKSVITYFSGGANYSIPKELAFDYCLRQLRFIFISYLITYYFAANYYVLTMALAMVLADLRYYIDFEEYMNQEDSDDTDEEE